VSAESRWRWRRVGSGGELEVNFSESRGFRRFDGASGGATCLADRTGRFDARLGERLFGGGLGFADRAGRIERELCHGLVGCVEVLLRGCFELRPFGGRLRDSL